MYNEGIHYYCAITYCPAYQVLIRKQMDHLCNSYTAAEYKEYKVLRLRYFFNIHILYCICILKK